jgi:signal transduction histidine kinase
MLLSRLPLFVKIFILLLTTILVTQILNLVLLVTFPPPAEPLFTFAQVQSALLDGMQVETLESRTVPAAEMKSQDSGLRDLRDRLASEFSLPPDDVIIEFAKSSSDHRKVMPEREGRFSFKKLFDPTKLMPVEAPKSAHIDLQNLSFSGYFKVARSLGNGNWQVISPKDSALSAWRNRAAIWLFGTVLLVAPFAYLLSFWLLNPIRKFTTAAERLGRNPHEPAITLDGPAEVIGAAKAFNEMKSRLNKYVDDRVAMMSAIAHDLRIPLTRLAFRLEKMPDRDRQNAEADIAEMKSMLAAVLSFVQTTQSKRPRQSQDLRSLITSIADDQADIGRDVQVENGADVVVQADDLALKSLFVNLVENAVSYGGRAIVRLWQDDSHAIVEIDDFGPGLPEAELERVFEPFYRSEPSRNRETGGIGLGLALVRSVAVAHGGSATLENRSPQGLRARVVLPLQARS